MMIRLTSGEFRVSIQRAIEAKSVMEGIMRHVYISAKRFRELRVGKEAVYINGCHVHPRFTLDDHTVLVTKDPMGG